MMNTSSDKIGWNGTRCRLSVREELRRVEYAYAYLRETKVAMSAARAGG